MNAILGPLEWMIIIGAPAAVVFFGIVRMKRKYRAEARRPFTGLPLRVAGQSTRLKADDLLDSASDDLLLILIGPALGLWYGFTSPNSSSLIGGILFIFVAAGTAWVGLRLKRKLRESWDFRLGALGEQVVGRELDQLIAQGYRVFHDLQFDGWNIDHAVVGPQGVFAVETKTWRKPRKESNLQAKIVFDGEGLIRPGKKSDPQAIEQARKNAMSLTSWISKAAAENVLVVPIVALPGWALDCERYGDVAVFSATNMSEPMIKRGQGNLQPDQIQRVAFQLAKCCEANLA